MQVVEEEGWIQLQMAFKLACVYGLNHLKCERMCRAKREWTLSSSVVNAASQRQP
jgi:hypothetical protein